MKNEFIEKRKSVRKFKNQALDEKTLELIKARIKTIGPLFKDDNYEITLNEEKISENESRYFLAFFGEENEKTLENIGFIGEQISLYLTSIGIGSYFKMAGKPKVKLSSKLKYIISMPLGLPAEPLFRNKDEFKRKSLTEISEGEDERIEAARLAPSAINAQGWYFIAKDGLIHCYRKKPNPLLTFFKNISDFIDMGIALSHIYLESDSFRFKKMDDAPLKTGYQYIGTVLK
ncbi:MAG: nitroreductase [Clostridiales bacterium]|nr:nitroreductase [Clostridiales bacterium]